MPRVVLARIRLRYACRYASSGTCTVMFPKPKSPSWNVLRSKLTSSVSVTTTCCAGAFAVGLFSNPIRYGIVESPVMKLFGPNPAGPEMKLGSTASVCSVSEWPAAVPGGMSGDDRIGNPTESPPHGSAPLDSASHISMSANATSPAHCGEYSFTLNFPRVKLAVKLAPNFGSQPYPETDVLPSSFRSTPKTPANKLA